jgi:AcrR family transcriptional regulator
MADPVVAAERVLRADAQRNLELILEAATEAFAEKGHEACVADIAQRAGVGQATIFRRFETKDDLIAAVLKRKLGQVLDAAEAAAEQPRAWDGLCAFMATATELQLRDRGFFQSSVQALMGDPEILQLKQQLMAEASELVARAHAEGSLRKDISAEDIPALCCAAAQAGAMSPSLGPDAAQRYLQVVTDGLRA